MITDLDAQLSAYVTDSFWQSGIEFVILFIIIAILANRFVSPIKSLCRALEGIEKGDLTHAVENKSRDEIGILERSFNGMLSNLTEIIRNIDGNSKKMAQSAYQVATISHEIAGVSKAEHNRSEEVTEATEQLRSISDSINALAEDVNLRAEKTEQSAHEGIQTVQINISHMENTVEEVNNASKEIDSLNESAHQINEILGTITEIADQTNLLALNATIGDDLHRVSESMSQVLFKFTYEHDENFVADENEQRNSPRVDAHLRVRVVQNAKANESICRDFSMTGMQLRFNEYLDDKMPVFLDVYLPYDNLDDYTSQKPVRIQANIAWQRESEKEIACGVKFNELRPAQAKHIKKCFAYYNKNSEFVREAQG